MQIKKSYAFDKWSNWADKLNESIKDFFESKTFYPNIIQANNHTFSQFDFLTNIRPDEKENIFRINEFTNAIEKPLEDESIKISSFENENTSLEFAVDDSLINKEFILIYDSDPDWDDDEEPVVEPPTEEFKSSIPRLSKEDIDRWINS